MSKSVFYFTFFNILVQIHSLIDFPSTENKDLAETEIAVRNTLNKLFSTLKLQKPVKPRWKQYIKIHEYFFSITLQDFDNLNEISKQVQVKNIDNSIQIFITQLNEILSKDNKSDETENAVYITLLIQTFLEGLEHLKETYGVKSNVTNFDINKTILKILDSDETVDNATSECNSNDPDIGVTRDPEFWVPDGRRIFQGKRVSVKQFPFMASIQFFKKFQCAGSIIKSDLVITSASCLQLAYNNHFYRENPAFLAVMIGSKFYEVGQESIPVMEIYFHPNYNPKNLNHNLAVMRLLRIIRFTKHDARVKKIEIDRRASALPINTNGITIVGWGSRDTSNIIKNPWKNRLSFAILDFYPLSICQDVYSKEYVTEKNFCAGFFSKGGGACNHDAGGPGVAAGVLVGVISFGSPLCGAPDAPTVFTKVGYYAEWIDGLKDMKVTRFDQPTTLKPRKKFTIGPKITPQFHPTKFKIDPVAQENQAENIDEGEQEDKEEKIEEEVMPPEDVEALEQTELFNKFLKTIFENDFLDDDINLNLEAESDETNAIIQTTAKLQTKVKSRAKYKPKSKLKTKVRTRKPKTKVKQAKAVGMETQFNLTTRMMDVHETNPPKYTKASIDALIKEPQRPRKRKGQRRQTTKKSYKTKHTQKVKSKSLEKVVTQTGEEPKEDKKQKDKLVEDYDDYDNSEGLGMDIDKKTKDARQEELQREEDYVRYYEEAINSNETKLSDEADGNDEIEGQLCKDNRCENKDESDRREYDENRGYENYEGLDIEGDPGETDQYEYANYDKDGLGNKDDNDDDGEEDDKNGNHKENNGEKLQINPLVKLQSSPEEGAGVSAEINFSEKSAESNEKRNQKSGDTDDEAVIAKEMKKMYGGDTENSEQSNNDEKEYSEEIQPITEKIAKKNKKYNNDSEKYSKMLAETQDVYNLLTKIFNDKT